MMKKKIVLLALLVLGELALQEAIAMLPGHIVPAKETIVTMTVEAHITVKELVMAQTTAIMLQIAILFPQMIL